MHQTEQKTEGTKILVSMFEIFKKIVNIFLLGEKLEEASVSSLTKLYRAFG